MRRHLKGIGRALHVVVSPSPAIQEPERRRRVLLLNTLLLIYLCAVWGMVPAIVRSRLAGEPHYTSNDLIVVATSAVIFSLVFILAKTRHYVMAGVLFCLTIDAGIVAAVASGPDQKSYPAVIPYLIIPVLIAMFVLPLRGVVAVGLVSLACAIQIAVGEASFYVASNFSFWFFVIALLMVLAGSLLRTFDTKQMEEERIHLFHAARMSTLGEMTSGIAHEVNNPVAVIQLRASQAQRVLSKQPVDSSKVSEFLEAIKRTASHIENVVRGLRSFSRSGLGDPFVETPVQAIVDETIGLCQEQLRHVNIELKVDPIEESLIVECRSIQISQILLNLISNARAAVRDLPERWIHLAVEDRSDRVAISVTDSGRGIPSGNAKKIFEPFFTTKKNGLGTGIGLSISLSLAKSQNGVLYLDPASRHTRFVLELPKVQPR